MRYFSGLFLLLGVISSGAGYSVEDLVLEAVRKEIPSVACSRSMAIANLNLNGQGNILAARPGEKVFCTVNFSCNTECIDSNSLNQIIIGYGNLGPSKCIFNELGYRCGGDRITSFYLEAPREVGVYDVQCSLEQAYSPVEAMLNWSIANAPKLTVGRIVVVN